MSTNRQSELNVNHAKTAANWYAEIGGDPAHAGIYTDGVILYVCLSEDSQARLVAKLGHGVVASARSDNGFCGAIIVRTDEWMHCHAIVSAFTDLQVTDNREKDDHTVSSFVGERLGGTRNG